MGGFYLFLEERKMDHLVRQNEGGRKMTNQIVREIFQTHGNKAKKLAFGQSVSIFQAHRGSPPHFIDLTLGLLHEEIPLLCFLFYTKIFPSCKFKCEMRKITEYTLCRISLFF